MIVAVAEQNQHRKMALLQPYMDDLGNACGGDSASSPRPDEQLDNTRHVGSCSLHAAPVVIGVLFAFWLLRRLFCREKLRTTYSGSEDAPELEEIVAADGGHKRRVESYSSRHGRLVVNAEESRAAGAPRPKKKKQGGVAAAELEPVLWRR